MSNLSELLPTGGGQNAVDFVASGTLSSGQTVILKSDGTVEAVTGVTEGVGTAVVFNNASTSFGDSGTDAVYDSTNNKVIIAYRDVGSGDGTAIVGTVSGTSISFGTAVVFETDVTSNISTVFDSTNNKIVIVYSEETVAGYGRAIVGTVSGTSISFGTAVNFENANSDEMSATFDSSANKVVIAYQDAGNSDYGTAIVGTVSGTSISFGTAVVFESASTNNLSATFDSNANKVVIAYRDAGNLNYGTAKVGTVSGTSISFGSPVVFESANTAYISATFDSNANKVVIAYRDIGNLNYGTIAVGTVSGTSISFGSPIVFESAEANLISATFDSSANKVVIAYQDGGNSSYGTSIVFQNASTNVSNFIGITAGAISDTATGAVNVYGGINEAQTGLTIAADYYVQADGSLSTTASDVKVGQAISATTINMMDLT